MRILPLALFALTTLVACGGTDTTEPAATTPTQEAATHADAGDAQVYACPMHPEETSDKPDSCGVCGMDLVLADASDDAKDGEHAH
ncbi:MAG: hypothetical protein JRJ84_06790 [Deltaproteobacteria bacterium]|nr:hypothetical protein [Deltaproteobacteria bacterium]